MFSLIYYSIFYRFWQIRLKTDTWKLVWVSQSNQTLKKTDKLKVKPEDGSEASCAPPPLINKSNSKFIHKYLNCFFLSICFSYVMPSFPIDKTLILIISYLFLKQEMEAMHLCLRRLYSISFFANIPFKGRQTNRLCIYLIPNEA